MKKFLIPFLALILALGAVSCSKTGDEAETAEVNPAAAGICSPAASEVTPPDTVWDVILQDSDNWYIKLNYNFTLYYSDYYYGVLELTHYGTVYSGDACGVYDQGSDILALTAEDGRNHDILTYLLHWSASYFNGPYVYLTGRYIGSIRVYIESGSIGPHSSAALVGGEPPNWGSFEPSAKAAFESE